MKWVLKKDVVLGMKISSRYPGIIVICFYKGVEKISLANCPQSQEEGWKHCLGCVRAKGTFMTETIHLHSDNGNTTRLNITPQSGHSKEFHLEMLEKKICTWCAIYRVHWMKCYWEEHLAQMWLLLFVRFFLSTGASFGWCLALR